MNAFLKTRKPPRAFVIAFRSAAEVIKSFLEVQGFRVPEDIYIFTQSSRPCIFPSMIQDPKLLGEKAAWRLVEKLTTGNTDSHHIKIPMKLNIPDSYHA